MGTIFRYKCTDGMWNKLTIDQLLLQGVLELAVTVWNPGTNIHTYQNQSSQKSQEFIACFYHSLTHQ